jgi:hypothetical protein
MPVDVARAYLVAVVSLEIQFIVGSSKMTTITITIIIIIIIIIIITTTTTITTTSITIFKHFTTPYYHELLLCVESHAEEQI